MDKQFTLDTLVKFKYYQLQSMMRALGAPRHLLHEPVAKMREFLVQYAGTSDPHNQRAWHAYEAIKSGNATDPSKSTPGEFNVDEAANRVLGALTEKVASIVDERTKAALEEVKAELVKQMTKYRPVEIVGLSKPKKLKARQHIVFERALQLASQRVNVLLVGPAGCGKTYLGSQLAEALDMNFGSISCSAGMSESQLAGWLLPTGAGGRFEYAPSPFVTIYEKGGVFLLDEIDSGDPNTLTFTNKALANDGFFVPQRLNKPFIKKSSDFVGLAAANTYGNGADSLYVGRNQLDAATLDRFRAGTVTMDYDKHLEGELCHSKVVEWGWAVRDKIRAHKLRRIMSTRVMLDLTKMTEAYKWGKEQWETAYFSDWSEDEKRRVTT